VSKTTEINAEFQTFFDWISSILNKWHRNRLSAVSDWLEFQYLKLTKKTHSVHTDPTTRTQQCCMEKNTWKIKWYNIKINHFFFCWLDKNRLIIGFIQMFSYLCVEKENKKIRILKMVMNGVIIHTTVLYLIEKI
jgi:hypothetical protein